MDECYVEEVRIYGEIYKIGLSTFEMSPSSKEVAIVKSNEKETYFHKIKLNYALFGWMVDI